MGAPLGWVGGVLKKSGRSISGVVKTGHKLKSGPSLWEGATNKDAQILFKADLGTTEMRPPAARARPAGPPPGGITRRGNVGGPLTGSIKVQ